MLGVLGADVLGPDAGTEVLAQYADQFYAGRAAAVTHKLGRGTVTYIGVDTLDGELERVLLHRVYESAGAAPANLDPNFLVDWRDGFWVATNFASQTEDDSGESACAHFGGTARCAAG